MSIILEFSNISKSFSGNRVIDNISLQIEKGKVHTLMGENGAGKSTLMKILVGLLQPDEGEILLEGEVISGLSVHAILGKGIAMIHQEILMVPDLSVAQNIFLGKESHRFSWLNESEINTKSKRILADLKLDISPKIKVKNLSIADRQMVEIAKAISNKAKVIIMDEPTSVLSDTEVKTLFQIIEKLKSEGVAIIYISHKMEEIFQISDTLAVLRDGKLISTQKASELNSNSLISLMVGREISEIFPESKTEMGRTLISVRNLSKKGVFSNINFEVKAGQVLGLAGLVGAGRSEIARAIAGLDKYDSGIIELEGLEVPINSPSDAIELGIGFVSEDRKALGFIPQMNIRENISLSSLKSFSKLGFVDTDSETKSTQVVFEDLKVKARGLGQKVISLSGGNQQKVVIGKVLMSNPKVIILDEPTRGIDVGAKFEIYKLINTLKAKGLAIILISSEMPEILGLCDRILVLSKGKQKVILPKSEASQEKIMQYAVH
ncbi:sugar ABC transporter ATP-binding protein [Lacihabitans soyangensis]|uniref:Sugar ABC transporter ATP-binding protein n=1 Tax=Lacihabitans soyangensis TaxID=869394 RepID=A0AAE3H6G4_9BACT|nr:sugar ABC transporter ATP-binding protein [Lacihabitans soyangensis]MCP9766159.1 sugar ABC transporter ATP-binding protein [Lacihabitans soyangensis]